MSDSQGGQAARAPRSGDEAGGAPIAPLHVQRLADGPASRRPVVLLHGFTGDTSTMVRLAEALAEDGPARAIWAVDLVGHGRSPAPDDPAAWSVPAQARAVAAALAGRGVERAIWLGYSMGGRVALAAAAGLAERVEALVLVGVSPGLADGRERAARRAADEALAASIERDGVAAFVDRWMALPLFATQDRLGPAHRERMRAQRLANRPEALAASLRLAGTGAMEPLWDALPALAMPVLLVAGELDAAYRALADAMAASLPRAVRADVAGSGHAVPLEAPAALAARVARFLEGPAARVE